ncbi:MAG: SDR family NAD(P)-dependent oxidoreductase [Bacteroidota bacterium]
MTNRLAHKTVLISGASAGIGAACATQFAEQGCHLIITGRREERLHALAKQILDTHDIRVDVAAFDIQDFQACEEFVSQLKVPVDLLINNAGLALGTDPIDKVDHADWDVMIDTNIKGVLALSRLLIPSMRSRNSGHVINIGSIAGVEAYPGGVVYTATKFAVRAITQATKKDVHGTNIRVSMISPGLVETEFSNVRFGGDAGKATSVYKGMQPLTADDIAEIVVFTANRPDHVNILDTLVIPVHQSSATMVYRNADEEL